MSQRLSAPLTQTQTLTRNVIINLIINLTINLTINVTINLTDALDLQIVAAATFHKTGHTGIADLEEVNFRRFVNLSSWPSPSDLIQMFSELDAKKLDIMASLCGNWSANTGFSTRYIYRL